MTKLLPRYIRTPHLTIDQQTFYFTNVDGRWMIALKPICDALGVQWNRQFRTVKTSPTLGQLLSQETIVAADGKPRKMVCLPERYIYGWLLRIDTRNARVIAFQMKCYDVLWDYFHSSTQQRNDALHERAWALGEQRKLKPLLNAIPEYRRHLELEAIVMRTGRVINGQDRAVLQEQLNLFEQTQG